MADYPGEPPPKQVVVVRSVEAGYGDANEGPDEDPAVAHGQCNAGFDAPYLDGYSSDGPTVFRFTSGQNYSAQDGKAEVTVDCTPSASASPDLLADEWFCWVTCSVSIYPVTVDISGGLDPTNSDGFLIGQKVGANLNTHGAPGFSTDTFSWTVEGGKPFDNFIASDVSGQYYPLWSLNPNNTQSISCYFSKPEQATFTCHANLAGQSVTVDAQAELEEPPVNLVNHIGSTQALPSPDPSYVQLISDTANAGSGLARGLSWVGTSVTTPGDYYEGSDDVGGWNWTQLWTPSRVMTFSDNSQEHLVSTTAGPLLGQEVLDTGYPIYHEWFLADGSPGGDSDSPFSSLPPSADVTELDVNERFRDFLMYTPPGDSVAVPLKQLNWQWGFNATHSGQDPWVVSGQLAVMGSPADLPDFPQWTSYAAAGQGNLYFP